MPTWEGSKNWGATYVGLTEVSQSCPSSMSHPSKYAGWNNCRDWYHSSTVGMHTGPEGGLMDLPMTNNHRTRHKVEIVQKRTWNRQTRTWTINAQDHRNIEKTINLATEERHGRHWQASGIRCWKYDKSAPNSDVCSLLLFLSVSLPLTSAIFCQSLMSQIRDLFRCGTPLFYFPFPTYTRTLAFSNLRRLHSFAWRWGETFLFHSLQIHILIATIETLSASAGKYILDVCTLSRDAEKHCLLLQTSREL